MDAAGAGVGGLATAASGMIHRGVGPGRQDAGMRRGGEADGHGIIVPDSPAAARRRSAPRHHSPPRRVNLL
ncbi:hypothetical protein CRM89_13830 [Nocardia sp. FDAARGOS_372]|nr:hypothetical protein CRM89_13830 [Nocardia sp. FDAARGOS_372]